MGPELILNGATVPLPDRPYTNLLDAVRGHGATGAKEGCAEGECGACAVLVARPRQDGQPGTQWVVVNSCLPPALGYAGQEVITAEGLGRPGTLHPVQAALAHRGGSQCGYCTPGFVTSMAGEYYRDRAGSVHGEDFDLESLSGNLCRCTGYRPIVDAAQALGSPAEDDPIALRRNDSAPEPVPVDQRDPATRFVRPRTLPEAIEILAQDPHAIPVAGATDLGVLVNLTQFRPAALVAVDRLAELRELSITDEQVRIGAALSLTEVEERLAGRVPLLSALLPQFSSRLIRNAATLGGNLGTASPIGDSPPALLALEAIVELAGPAGRRDVALADYFTGYRTTVRRPDELIVAVRFATSAPGAIAAFHKIAKRRLDDISSVAVAYQLQIVDGVVASARIGLGGVAATPLRAKATEAALTGRPWTAETIEAAGAVLQGEGTPMDDHRASAAYRSAMLGTSLPRLFHEVTR